MATSVPSATVLTKEQVVEWCGQHPQLFQEIVSAQASQAAVRAWFAQHPSVLPSAHAHLQPSLLHLNAPPLDLLLATPALGLSSDPALAHRIEQLIKETPLTLRSALSDTTNASDDSVSDLPTETQVRCADA